MSFTRTVRLEDKEVGLIVYSDAMRVLVLDKAGPLVDLRRPPCGHSWCAAVMVWPRARKAARPSVEAVVTAIEQGRIVEGGDPTMLSMAWCEHESQWLQLHASEADKEEAHGFVADELDRLFGGP